MDQIGVQFQHQKTNIVDQKKIKPTTSHRTLLKKVTKLLFSISLFSFFFTNLHFPFHFHNFHFFNQPIDKNSMFLLCNALLVFLANYSGLFKSLSSSPKNFDPNFRIFDLGLDFLQKPSSIPSETAEERKDDAHENRASFEEEEDEEEMFGGETGEVEEMMIEEEEEEEEGGVLSDEELNRKFDEFIKRMKEEIILDDAPRTLVVV